MTPNFFLIIGSCALAVLLPFELFLLSYIVLGPLHYLTEIAWLQKRQFFLPRKHDFLLLLALGILLLILVHNQVNRFGVFPTDAIALALIASVLLLAVKDIKVQFVAISLIALGIYFLPKSQTYFLWIGLFLPTVVHVSLFTLLFMIRGAQRTSSRTATFECIVYILCCVAIFKWGPPTLFFSLDSGVMKVFQTQGGVTLQLAQLLFGTSLVPNSTNVFTQQHTIVGARLLAFMYTYHYLNWFSKIKIWGWLAGSTKGIRTLCILWGASVLVYIFNVDYGLYLLLGLSLLHVLLEFPLVILTGKQVGTSLVKSALNK